MILQINKLSEFSSNMINDMKVVSNSAYPKQDTDKLGKIVLLRYTDERESGIINARFSSTETSYHLSDTNKPSYFLVCRYDSVYPYRAILFGSGGEVIVTSTNVLSAYLYPPDYTSPILTNSKNFCGFSGKSELIFSEASTMADFNSSLSTEFIHKYPIQNPRFLGVVAYTEYLTDILSESKSANTLNGTAIKDFEDIKEELFAIDNINTILPDELLKSFKLFYDAHHHSNNDIPRRVMGSGIVIRADEGGGEIVIAEFDDTTIRFVTANEGFYYIEDANRNKGLSISKFKEIITSHTLSEGV